MSKEPLGSGRRFRYLEKQLAGKPGVRDPAALAAHIGRQKWGSKRFSQLANASKKGVTQGEQKPPEARVRARGAKRVRL